MPQMSSPPFRARPGMPPPGGMPRQGGKGKPPMLADGGIGSPEPIGGPASMPPPMKTKTPPPPAMDPDQDGDMDSPGIRPEAVNFHDDAQNCGQCLFMDEGNQCSVLRMAVSPEGGCNAYEPKGEQAAPPTEGAQPGEDAGDTGMGTSGTSGAY